MADITGITEEQRKEVISQYFKALGEKGGIAPPGSPERKAQCRAAALARWKKKEPSMKRMRREYELLKSGVFQAGVINK